MTGKLSCGVPLGIVAAIAGLLVASPLRAADRPNVILVMTDDQGYGDLSVHGNPVLKTPNLDRLHSQSVRFTDFHVAPMCTPTRGQLLTGRDAMDNGATFVCLGRSMMRGTLPTMADIFAASDYQTGLFGKWHLGDSHPHRPLDRGFQTVVRHGAWGITSIPDDFGNDYFDDTYRHTGRLEKYKGYCTDVWFDALRSDGPGKARADPGSPPEDRRDGRDPASAQRHQVDPLHHRSHGRRARPADMVPRQRRKAAVQRVLCRGRASMMVRRIDRIFPGARRSSGFTAGGSLVNQRLRSSTAVGRIRLGWTQKIG